MNMKELMYLFLTVTFLVSCSTEQKSKKEEAMPVRVFCAERAVSEPDREFTFLSQPFKSTGLSFRVGGPVLNFDVRSGQFFRKGEVIASIDDRDFKVRKEKAEAVYQQAEAEYKRIAALYEKENISASTYEKAKADCAIARAAYQTAANEWEDTRLYAPFDGYIQTVNIERYQEVRASQPVVSFIDLSRLKIEAYIPENMAVILQKQLAFSSGSGLKFRFDALKDKVYTTTDVEVSKSTTSNNLSFLLTAVLDNQNNELLGGMSGTLTITLPGDSTVEKKSVFIPQLAVCHRPTTGTFVWKLTEDNRVKTVPVNIGDLKNDNKIEVVSGLSVGDIVVLSGHGFLSEDREVSVIK
ncbi:efflux RND transporter periplasmic adaptor subunit [Bacteroides nordii]|uniref:efflux RND transporter periplasmic adaptor subunit n=1 Tax=Bacteroides nordii TaxID=291645 RepID=UPI001F344800|nr:efflux RND transporter periplasmic adaptor subunit [Bacteroides nordii]MCE8466379.1 efflux RND transporter periplasmic adaptor subunit [Bacteroides nordii]UYU47550.1 efflux RND transporter periplasmic adaptor subunit [Bacteroides nordii]